MYPKLVKAEVTGSSQFKITGNFEPRELRSEDSVMVTYRPLRGQRDEARLTLTFWTGDIEFDTTIVFTGQGASPLPMQLNLAVSNPTPSVDERVTLNVTPSSRVENRGLNDLTFTLTYRDDLFHLASATSSVGTVGMPVVVNGRMQIPVQLTGSNITLDPATPLLELRLDPRVTDSTHTDITIGDLRLNGGDVKYANCQLAASAQSASIDLLLGCGDRTLQRFISGERAVEILSLVPNPATGSATATIRVARPMHVIVEVIDIHGVIRIALQIPATTTHTIELADGLVSGTYILRVRGEHGVATRQFVVR
jgi:hypothetical protein